jgi:hypothetical protein
LNLTFKVVFTDCEHDFDHVLNTLVIDRVGLFVQNRTQGLEQRMQAPGRLGEQLLAAVFEQTNGNLDRMVRGILEQKRQNLQSENLVRHILIDQVSDHLARAYTLILLVLLVRGLELNDEAFEKEFADLREFCVYDSDETRVDVRKCGRKQLSLHNRTAKQATTSHDILAEEFSHYLSNIWKVDFVDEAVYALFECFPGQALKLDAVLVGDGGLQGLELRWGYIRTAGESFG